MESIRFQMDGPIFQRGLPLHVVAQSLDALQGIIDKSFLIPQGRERASQDDRRIYYVKAHRIEHGSLLADLELVIEYSAPLLPIVSTMCPENVWLYTKSTFEFLKLVLGAKKKGQSPTVQVSESKDVSVHLGNNTFNFHGPVNLIAQAALPSYRRITEFIGPDGVDKATLSTQYKGVLDVGFDLQKGEKDLFEPSEAHEEQEVEIDCEIYDFNKYENKGRLRVLPGQEIAEGKYPFSIRGEQNSINYIQSMLEPKVRVRCAEDLVSDPLSGKSVSRLFINSISSR